ncbi:MAG: transglycosylase SLT domain-containing protein [Deltaproteobacteria bacterium]|jgi:hypothetical protein|nr:transglycosylase SLT domain-containing protein [Deltaproteobacteria bacterium]
MMSRVCHQVKWLKLLGLMALAALWAGGFLSPAYGADEFAGEKIPLNQPNVAENLDQELLLLSEAKARVFLTLRRSLRHLPLIDAALAQNKVPIDFRYLPMTLTSLAPAYQAGGRAGLWRLTVNEAKTMGLTVSSEVDERLDPVASTNQAANKLKNLIAAHKSPVMALAAFIDERSLLAAQAAAGGAKNFFSLYITESLEKPVYQVLAGKYLFGDPAAYGYPNVKPWPPLAKNRQKLTAPTSLKELAAKSKVDYKTFRDLNPHFLTDIAPAGFFVNLP